MKRLKHSSSIFVLLGLIFLVPACGPQQRDSRSSYQRALAHDYEAQKAHDIVRYLSQRWRLRGGGNKGYNESIDHVRDFLAGEGFEQVGRVDVLEGPLTLEPLAWEPIEASLSVVQPEETTLHTYSETPTFIGRYCGSTPEEGVTAELIEVGDGTKPEDYGATNVRGKVVLGSGPAAKMFEQAVEKRGALGVISDRIGSEEKYSNNPDKVRGVRLPFREKKEMMKRTGWGLKVSPRSGTYLRRLLSKGPVRVHVKVRTRFFESTLRELVAEIPGRSKPEERIVLVSHIDNAKPGANNNASGVGTHAELAVTIANAIHSGKIRRPSRTLTFLFGAEREGSRLWIQQHEDTLKTILAVLNADMAGENTDLTRGPYRLERYPDPAAFHSPRPEAYTAPNDHHTGWPMRRLDIDPYPGHFLNDFFLSVLESFAKENQWRPAQNPYEGGSDHDVFLALRVPTVLSWHYPDYFVGTNFDTADKVSPEEMKRVATIHGTVALSLASANEKETLVFLDVLEQRARKRFQQELETSRRLLSDVSKGELDDKGITLDQQLSKELEYLGRWARWYDEAIRSVEKIPVEGASARLHQALQSTWSRCRELAAQEERQLREMADGLGSSKRR